MGDLSRLAGFALVVILLIPARVEGQDQATTASTGRKFDPPVTTVEITGNEPAAKSYQLVFGGGGGTGPIPSSRVYFRAPSQTPYWVITPVLESPSFGPSTVEYKSVGELVACNYHSGPAPRATLIDPEGKQEPLTAIRATDIPGETGCWRVNVPVKAGMPLGLYTLTLDHPQGQISHQWGIDYLPCVNISVGFKIEGDHSVTNERALISGLAPRQTFNAYFFHVIDLQAIDTRQVDRIADRQVTSGDSGEALIDLRVARSAPYDLSSVIYLLVGPDGKLIYVSDPYLAETEAGWNQLTQDLGIVTESTTVTAPTSRYATYLMSVDTTSTICSQKLGMYAQTTGNSVPLYHDFGASSNQTGTIPAGDPVLVLEQKAAIMNGRVVVWSHVKTESGADGWSVGNQFQAADIALIPGSKLEIQQIGTSNGQPRDVNLRKAPQANAETLTTLKPASQVTLIQDLNLQPDWLYVKDVDGNIGYIPLAINYQTGQPAETEVANIVDPYELTAVALPWAPADVSNIPTP